MEEKKYGSNDPGSENGKEKNGKLSKEQEYKIDRNIRIGIILGAVVILAYLIYCGVNKIEIGTLYFVLVIVFVILYWLFSDVVSLVLKHGFTGRTDAQKSAYYKMAVLDLIGCAGLGMFLIGGFGSGSSEQSGRGSLIGALIYMVCLMSARRLRADYEKDSEQKEDEKDGEKQKQAAPAVLPTAADRERRKATAAEKIAQLNRQAMEAGEPAYQKEPANEEKPSDTATGKAEGSENPGEKTHDREKTGEEEGSS